MLEEALLLGELGRPIGHLPLERAREELAASARISAPVRALQDDLPAFVAGLRRDLKDLAPRTWIRRPPGQVDVEWDRVPGHLVDVADRALVVQTTGNEWYASIAATMPAPAALWLRTVRRSSGELLQQRPMRRRSGRYLAEGGLPGGEIRFDVTVCPSMKPRTPEELRRQLDRQDDVRKAFLRRREDGTPFLAEVLVHPDAVTRRPEVAAGAAWT